MKGYPLSAGYDCMDVLLTERYRLWHLLTRGK